MASKTVMDAIAARVGMWSGIGACPLVDLNEVETSPLTKYLEIEYPYSKENRESIGTPGLFRETGGVRLIVNVLVSSGIGSAAADVETLRDLLRDKDDFAGAPTLNTLEAGSAVFDTGNQKGAFYQVPFVVLYQFDIER